MQQKVGEIVQNIGQAFRSVWREEISGSHGRPISEKQLRRKAQDYADWVRRRSGCCWGVEIETQGDFGPLPDRYVVFAFEIIDSCLKAVSAIDGGAFGRVRFYARRCSPVCAFDMELKSYARIPYLSPQAQNQDLICFRRCAERWGGDLDIRYSSTSRIVVYLSLPVRWPRSEGLRPPPS